MTPPPPPPPADEATAAAAAAAEAALSTSTENPHDECVLCCYPLPLHDGGSVYRECCGQVICIGCLVDQHRVLIIGTNVEKPIKGSTEEELEFKMLTSESLEELEFKMLTSEVRFVCPFCRKPEPTNHRENRTRFWERIDEYKDPKAMLMLGCSYEKGKHGLSKNIKTAEELYKRAYDLGDPNAAHALVALYTEHIPDEARMLQYAEEGVRRGNGACMNAVGVHAHQSGNYEEATRYFMMAARSGVNEAMSNVMKCFRQALLSNEDLATTLRAHQAANDAGKSEPREYATRYLEFKERML